MPNRQVITEFLATISPSYNVQQWQSVAGDIGNKLNVILGKTIFSGTNERIKELEKQLDILIQKRDTISKSIRQTSNQRESLLTQIEEIDKDTSLSDEEKTQRKAPLQEQLKNVEELLSKQRAAQKNVVDEINKTSTTIDSTNTKLANFGGSLSKSVLYIAGFVTAVKAAWEAAQQIAEEASEISNRFISQGSIFVDTDIRDIMARFGISSEQAQSMSAASKALGIDLSDYSRLTAGQRQAFDELMSHYQEGIDSIDDEKLQKFNESVQEYQLTVVQFQMDLQLALQKILTESDAVPELLDTIGDAMESITKIISSDAFQTAADIILGIINGILEFATAPLNFLGSLFGGGSSSTTTTTNNTTNNNNFNINTSGGISSQQLALDLSMQLQNATTP